MPRKFYKFKLLLDEGFIPRARLPILNSRYDVKHIAIDFGKTGLSDDDVYKLATRQERLIITFNIKHFRKLVRNQAKTGVIGISANMPSGQIDKKLTSFLIRSKKKDLFGKLTT